MTFNMINNIQEKEAMIVSTLLECNNQIIKLSKLINLSESVDNLSLYKYNFTNLLGDVIPLFESTKVIPENLIMVKNSRNNYYAYFQKVNEYVSDFNPMILKTLNESLKVTDAEDDSMQLNIETFKTTLTDIISKLSKIDEISKYSEQIIKIKTFAKKPVFVYGYNIINNIALQKELKELFNKETKNILSICFDKAEKRLLFLFENYAETICYDLKTDTLDYYNKLILSDEFPEELPNTVINKDEYLSNLKELIHNNIISLYLNVDKLGLKFTDNLYGDFGRTEMIKKFKEQSKTIKD